MLRKRPTKSQSKDLPVVMKQAVMTSARTACQTVSPRERIALQTGVDN